MSVLGCAMWCCVRAERAGHDQCHSKNLMSIKRDRIKGPKTTVSLDNSFRSNFMTVQRESNKNMRQGSEKAVVRECFMDEVGTTVDLGGKVFFF